MSTLWSFIASFALPTPLLLLVLLNLPLPLQFKRGIYIFVARVVATPIVGVFKCLHVMMAFLALTFINTARTLQQLHVSHDTSSPFATPKYEIMFLSKRWRCERNLWLAGFAFSMWAVLAAFLKELGARMKLESRLVEFEMSGGYTATVDDDTTHTREASVSKEVTSQHRNVLSPRSLTASPTKPGAGGGRRQAAVPPTRHQQGGNSVAVAAQRAAVAASSTPSPSPGEGEGGGKEVELVETKKDS